MNSVLIIDDDKELCALMKKCVEQENLSAVVAHGGLEGLRLLEKNKDTCSLIILDVMMPDMNGFQVLQKIREKNNVPVLMLTARDDISDKVTGLDRGADDYMTKPFIPEELLARIRALSRRQGEVVVEELHFGDLTLNLSTNDLVRGRKSIHLGYKEFEVLKLLMNNAGKIISKDMLISRVWGNDSDAEDNNVEAYISFLRKKLSFLSSKVEIVTVRKVGYRLEEPSC